MQPQSRSIIESIAEVIINDIVKVSKFRTKVTRFYISITPSPDLSEDEKKEVCKKVNDRTCATLTWGPKIGDATIRL